MQEKGYVVLRFWEHEINDNAEGCLDVIEDTMNLCSYKLGE